MRLSHCCDIRKNNVSHREIALQDEFILTILRLLNIRPAKKDMSPFSLRQTFLSAIIIGAHPPPIAY